jgi:putative ABC transport system substrate-binding protein
MSRIGFAIVLTLGLIASPLGAEAQTAARIPRIGVLALSGNVPKTTEALQQAMRDLGYVEGRDVATEYRSAEGKPERLAGLTVDLIALGADVIVAAGDTSVALAARQVTKAIPIVLAGAADPVTNGLVASLGKPGGNVTGLAVLSPELIGKCLEQIKEAVPWIARAAVLWQPGTASERAEREMLQDADLAAGKLDIRLRVVKSHSADDFSRAFAAVKRGQADALTVLSSPVFLGERRRLADLAKKNRLPTVSTFPEYVDAGGLMSYGPSGLELLRRAAGYVDKILKGARPGDLPVEQPTTFELIVNLKTARALGLTIPSSMLGRADRVIE